MKSKFVNFAKSSYGKVSFGLMVASAPVYVFADSPAISTSISTAMQVIVTDTLATISAVAPIGITIFGAMFCWKKGMQFFRSVAK